MIGDLRKDLRAAANAKKAQLLMRFFKTGKGEYGEGDIFLGVMVPEQRKIAKRYHHLDSQGVNELLHSKYHEERLVALLILIEQYKKADIERKKRIFDFYLANTEYINNWDLVDLSAPHIVGGFLSDKDRDILKNLARSSSLWERRIAILACFMFIRERDFKDALVIAQMLVEDKEDLIQKAVGWMLREIGKRDIDVEEDFLKKNYRIMGRTMLRYAIEKFPEGKRKKYLGR